MAYEYESQRHGADPHSRAGLRPHEFPGQGESSGGPLAILGVFGALLLLLILLSIFAGGGDGTVEGTPGAETPAAAAPTVAE